MSTFILEPCQRCPNHDPCSTFDPDADLGHTVIFFRHVFSAWVSNMPPFVQNTCFCGHNRQDHQPSRRQYPPRGGLPAGNCPQFTTVHGQPVWTTILIVLKS